MRLWSLHPKYLDGKGLGGVWREALLAQSVLQGRSSPYQHHPQLIRFRAQSDPLSTLAVYLEGIAKEADQRGYHYNHNLISKEGSSAKIPVTRGQLHHEWEHLKGKLLQRDPARYAQIQAISEPEPHPLFTVVPGEVEAWEGRHPRRKTGAVRQ
jgi:hypothetical protein